MVQDFRFSVEPKSSDPACLYYASPTTTATRWGSASAEMVLLDAPWEAGQLSSRTFRCLLLGRRKNPLGSSPAVLGYLVLEATGQKPNQYHRVGWSEVLEWNYDGLLRVAGRESVSIV
jgi:hypothetical protein